MSNEMLKHTSRKMHVPFPIWRINRDVSGNYSTEQGRCDSIDRAGKYAYVRWGTMETATYCPLYVKVNNNTELPQYGLTERAVIDGEIAIEEARLEAARSLMKSHEDRLAALRKM